jgi:hypothetical protein
VGVEARVGELLLAGLSEEAQKTDQMGVEILSDTSSYMYGMRGAHHGQAGYTTLGEPESGLESLIEMVDAMDSSAAEEVAPVAQHAIGGQYLLVQVGRAMGARSGVSLRPRTGVCRHHPVLSAYLLPPPGCFSLLRYEVCVRIGPWRIWVASMLFGGPSPPFRMAARAVVIVHAVGCLLDVQRAFGR